MGNMIELTASDGHVLAGYRADPQGTPKGGVVVIQEIFGVNQHVREVVDGYARDGYAAIAPAMFDRLKRGVELGYEGDDVGIGRDLAFPMGWETPVLDIEAAAKALGDAGKVATVGYCWGGSLSYLAACKLDVACAVGYYGGQIMKILGADSSAHPKAPTLLHFGERDAGIPLDVVEQVKAANPSIPVHMYEAGHGFNCDHRGSYDAPSAKLALKRTLAFFDEHLSS